MNQESPKLQVQREHRAATEHGAGWERSAAIRNISGIIVASGACQDPNITIIAPIYCLESLFVSFSSWKHSHQDGFEQTAQVDTGIHQKVFSTQFAYILTTMKPALSLVKISPTLCNENK